MAALLTASAKHDGKRWKINVMKEGVRRSFYSSTPGRKGKAEAEAKAIEWLDSHSMSDPTFEVAWGQYIESRKAKVGTSGQHSDEWAGKYYLLPALGKKKLSRITVQDWQDILDQAVKDGKAKATVADIKTRITGFRKYCLKKRWPCEALDLLENSATKKEEKHILSRQDVKTVFTNPTTMWHKLPVVDLYWNAYRLTIILGYRRGEVCGMKWEDLDGNRLTISRSINGYNEMTGGKNENARRTVLLPKTAMEILEAQKEYLRIQGIISPWIFPNADGDMTLPANLYKRWKAYLKVHDIPHISFHEIRHTMVSHNKKMTPALLKAVVGHSESMDTFGIYGHMEEEDYEEAAEDIEAALRAVLA